MAQPITSLQKSTNTQTGNDLGKFVKDMAYSVQSSQNQAQRTETIKNKFSNRNRFGDSAFRLNGSNLDIMIQDSKGNVIKRSLSSDLSNFMAYQTGTVIPTVAANFPTDGSWGWYLDSTTGYLYLPRNAGGTLRNITITTLEGVITITQHGNQSAAGGTSHAFTQISGAITAAQHGNLATGTLHSFPVISGTITDAQHGSLSGGATHASAGASAGFMSAGDKTKLDAATASATASTICLRDASGNINGTSIEVSGTKVVGARNTGWVTQTAVASKVDLGAAPTVGALASWASAVDSMLKTHGLIGT